MGPTFSINTKDLKRLERRLMDLNHRGIPYATRQTLNDLAFTSMREWRQEMPGKMILRGPFTQRSTRFDKASSLDIRTQRAVVGSVADYMLTQEEGATEAKKGKHGVPVPAVPLGRRRMGKANQLRAIQLMRVHGPRARQTAIAFSLARKRGGPQYAYLEPKAGKGGIFRIDPSKKKKGMKKIWSVSKSSVTIPRNPTMGPAVERAMRLQPMFYHRALMAQLRRLK